jgi:threonine/homoserine/homoserine lactone efflux protein
MAAPHWLIAFLPSLLTFAGVWLLIAMVPGPSTAIVIRQTLRAGRWSAFNATIANELGLLLWALAATFGVSSLIAASQVAYDVIRIAGAVVLVALGMRSIWQARRGVAAAAAPDAAAAEPGWKGFRVGLVTILANPKAAAFVFGFLPQFVPRGAPVLPCLLMLSTVLVLVDGAWYVLLAGVVSLARRLLTRPAIGRRMEQLSGAVMIGLGVRLAVERL